nr:MAG TPA: Large Terminase [Caudoviricetes sp.]
MTTSERVARHVAKHNEIGDIPPPLHPALRARCRDDLALFGWVYCRNLLDHEPSDEFRRRIVDRLQSAILRGGQLAVEAMRGGGKTTWFVIAVCWGVLYGHFRFPLLVSASLPLARSLRKTILDQLELVQPIADDFPAVAIPLRRIGGVVQKGAALTYRGRGVGFVSNDLFVRLPTLTDDNGQPLDAGCGAVVAVRGVGASVRGLNVGGLRPDFVLLDDPQTRKDAHSPSAVERLDGYIHADVLGLASNTATLSAFVAITPQCFGDLASRIFDRSLHPNWTTSVCPAILAYCPDFETLADAFTEAFNADAANGDFARTSSTAWYRAHADAFTGTVLTDPAAFDREREVDAIHHALNKLASIGKQAFATEYQMQVSVANAELALTPDAVAACTNGAAKWTLPPGCDCAVAACDINIQKGEGLSWVVVAFGPRRSAAVVAYGRYPETGALVRPGSSDLARKRAVARAMRIVTAELAAHPLRTQSGRTVSIRALGFDRGYLPDVVSRTLFVIRKTVPLPFQLCAMRGFGWRQFGSGRAEHQRGGDHVFATRSDYGDYLAVHAPYWREIAQSGFLETPLMPGSCSLFGSDPKEHWQFATEVANERLERKYTHPSGKVAWDWSVIGANHFGDALTSAFALGSYFHCFAALPRVLDDALTVSRPRENADLFDPRLNPAMALPSPPQDERPTAHGAGAPSTGRIQPTKPPRFARARFKHTN